MIDQHDFGRETGHSATEDPTHAAEGTRREDPLATTDHLIDAVAVGIERRGVHVDLMTFRIDELEAVRQPASGLNVPACAERLLDLRGVLEPRDEVEIVVRPRLLAEERVDRPAAVQPELDPQSFEIGEKIQDAVRVHLGLRFPPAAGSSHQPARREKAKT